MRLPFVILIATAGLLSATSHVVRAQETAVARPSFEPSIVEIRQDDLIADYIAATEPGPRGAVVVLGGSEGGLQGSRGLARALAAEGIDAIAVSYFGEPGQSPVLNRVPIEPVGRAIEWLQARPGGVGPIAVVGVSKGAELALLTASLDDRITAVVAGAPTHLVWDGVDQSGGRTDGSWTRAGETVPYAPYDLSGGFQGMLKLYTDSLAGAPEAAHIPVERINGPVLLVSAPDDGLWPAGAMSRTIVERLEARDFPHEVEHLDYDGAGHGVFGPPIPQVTERMRQMLPFMGGTPEGLMRARADGWPRVVAFLKAALTD